MKKYKEIYKVENIVNSPRIRNKGSIYPNHQTNLNKNNSYFSSKTQYLHLKIGNNRKKSLWIRIRKSFGNNDIWSE